MRSVQLEFTWAATPLQEAAQITLPSHEIPIPESEAGPQLSELAISKESEVPRDLPIAEPLPEAVAHGVFGWTEEGPFVPDREGIESLTAEHAHELIVILCDLQALQMGIQNGTDPATGRTPQGDERRDQLVEQLRKEKNRLLAQYDDALSVYEEAFGESAALALDGWARAVAHEPNCENSYPPDHPWHYYHAGDNADPVPADVIPATEEIGVLPQTRLPNDYVKRATRLRELYETYQSDLRDRLRRYEDVVNRGADALSHHDIDIAYGGSREMAKAGTLALLYRQIAYFKGCLLWLENEIKGSH